MGFKVQVSRFRYARQQLALVPGLTLIGNPKHRVSVISFVLNGISVPETGRLLDQEGIAVGADGSEVGSLLKLASFQLVLGLQSATE